MTTEGRHTNPELMRITVPAGYTPGYFDPHNVTKVLLTPYDTGNENEWLVTGMRSHLVTLANKIAHMHFDCASPVH